MTDDAPAQHIDGPRRFYSDALCDRVARAGFEVDCCERHPLDGYERFHCRDAFGNRVEILTPATSPYE